MRYLKIQSLEPVKSGWYDKDEILIHAAFQCLVDFLEKENPAKSTDYKSDARHRFVWKEMNELYKWWKKDRPKLINKLPNASSIEDKKNLHRLVEIMDSLWT